MGDMADLAAEEYYASLGEEVPGWMKVNSRKQLYKTENVLNSTTWTDGQGIVHELKNMERDHLQNVLYFIYKRRDRYWLNCKDVSMIDRFKDGDEFFQNVIRKSTIWNAILDELKTPYETFNFEFKEPGEDEK